MGWRVGMLGSILARLPLFMKTIANGDRVDKSMGTQLPEDVTVMGIATNNIYGFSEDLSPRVARVVPGVAQIVLDLVSETVIIY